jgi:hypothetical protein
MLLQTVGREVNQQSLQSELLDNIACCFIITKNHPRIEQFVLLRPLTIHHQSEEVCHCVALGFVIWLGDSVEV